MSGWGWPSPGCPCRQRRPRAATQACLLSPAGTQTPGEPRSPLHPDCLMQKDSSPSLCQQPGWLGAPVPGGPGPRPHRPLAEGERKDMAVEGFVTLRASERERGELGREVTCPRVGWWCAGRWGLCWALPGRASVLDCAGRWGRVGPQWVKKAGAQSQRAALENQAPHSPCRKIWCVFMCVCSRV